jgi:hypothetical protein
MPGLQEFGLMIEDNPFNLVQFAGSEAIIGSHEDRIEPKLGLIACRFDMNVRWFLAFIAKEVESEPADA